MIKFINRVVFILSILCLIGIVSYWNKGRTNRKRETFFEEFPTIVCLMVTGKDEMRIHYAKQSVANFKSQNYPNKKLVIFNHSDRRIPVINRDQDDDTIHEFFIDKSKDLTLGAIRNMMLELVGYDNLWITWDDDDWRSPELLTMMHREMRRNNAVAVSLTNRFEYNINQEFVWKSHLAKGFPHILAIYDQRTRYLDKDTMEDVELIEDYTNMGKVVRLDNANRDYIRLVHGSNTSLYVNPNKQTTITNGNANYNESQTSKKERESVIEIMSRYRNENIG